MKTLPMFPSAFSRLAEAAALKLRVEQTPAFHFSEQAAKALKEARESPSVENVAMACRLAAAELEGSAALGEAAKTLSMLLALPVSSASRKGMLAYPIFGTALAAKPDGQSGPTLVDLERLSWAHEGRVEKLESFQELRGAYGIPPLARATRDMLEDARARRPEALMTVEGVKPGGRKLRDEYSSEMALEGAAKNEAYGRRGSYGESGLGLGEDALPMRRALGAHAEMMARLLGDEPGPGSLYEIARGMLSIQLRVEEEGEEPSNWSEGRGSRAQAQWEQLRQAAAKRGGEAAEFAARLDEPLRRLLSAESGAAKPAMEERKQWQAEAAERAGGLKEQAKLWEADASSKPDLSEWVKSAQDAALVALGGSAFGKRAHLSDHLAGPIAALKRAQKQAFFERAKREKVMAPGVRTQDGEWIGGEAGEQERDEGGLAPDAEEEIGWALKSLILCHDLLAEARLAGEVARKRGEQERMEGAKEGLRELFELGDGCLMAAARVAEEREIAALGAMGMEGAVKALRSDEGQEDADEVPFDDRMQKPYAPTMQRLAKEQEKEEVRSAGDRMQKMLLARSRIEQLNRHGAGVERALSIHMAAAESKEQLEAFAKSEPGAFYIEALEKAVMGQLSLSKQGMNALYLACLQEFKSPGPAGEGLHEGQWRERALELVSGGYVEWDWAGSDRGRALKFIDGVWEGVSGGSPENWAMIIEAFGDREGLGVLDRRAKAAREQAGAAARWQLDTALGKSARDAQPQEMRSSPLKKGREPFWSLPYGFEADQKTREYFAPTARREPAGDAEVEALLAQEGFAGEMALGAKQFYEAIETREGADARSRANAWIAAGKRLCKEELGLTEAAYRMAKEHAGSGKRVAAMLGPILKERQAAKAALGAPLAEAKTRSLEFRRGRRLGRLLAAAASRGAGAQAAFVASEALRPGEFSAGDLELSKDYVEAARAPMASGASVGEVIGSLRRESAASRALAGRFDAALLERAVEALKGVEKLGDEEQAKAERRAVKAMREDLDLVEDWAKDSKGSFFSQLDPKFDWGHLRRGQEAWHEEVIQREVESGAGWKAALGGWSSESGWTAEELLTPSALAEEGKAMRHCVGGYSSECLDGASRIFSLKKNGIRALTAQFSLSAGRCCAGELPLVRAQWQLRQNKGPCNIEPSKEGAQATRALQAALQSAWDARLEQALKEAPAREGGSEAVEIPGFNPDEHLDLARFKRAKAEGALRKKEEAKSSEDLFELGDEAWMRRLQIKPSRN